MTKKKEGSNSEVQCAPAAHEPEFPIEKLRENCTRLFGVSVSTFDGAAYGLNRKYTVGEMKLAIQKWKDKEVK